MGQLLHGEIRLHIPVCILVERTVEGRDSDLGLQLLHRGLWSVGFSMVHH